MPRIPGQSRPGGRPQHFRCNSSPRPFHILCVKIAQAPRKGACADQQGERWATDTGAGRPSPQTNHQPQGDFSRRLRAEEQQLPHPPVLNFPEVMSLAALRPFNTKLVATPYLMVNEGEAGYAGTMELAKHRRRNTRRMWQQLHGTEGEVHETPQACFENRE